MRHAVKIVHTALMKTTRLGLGRHGSRIGPDPHGLTVVDLVIGLAIMAIVATVAIPNMQPLMTRYRLNGATRAVIGDLMAARMKAVRQDRRVQLFFAEGHQYSICDDANGDNVVNNCEGNTQQRDLHANYAGVSVAATNNPLFNRTGSAAGNTIITLTNVQGTRTITVFPSGQVIIN